MDKILIYILIGLVGYFLVGFLIKIFTIIAKNYFDNYQKVKDQKRKEKLKWRYCHVDLDNYLLNRMMQDRTIVFMGAKGCGKSLFMNLFAHFLVEKRIEQDKKNKRYNKYKNQERLEENKFLEENNLLPVYSNLEFADYETGAKSQELEPYFEMHIKAVQGAIFCIDEVSSTYGKDNGDNEPLDDDTKKAVKENSKKNRHFTNGWILGTEQDGDDIWKGIRENGYALVHCLQTIVHISKFGKFLRSTANFLNIILPAIFTVNLKEVFRKQLFLNGKVKTFFKLLLPSYFTLPYEFYTQKERINEFIKYKFQRFSIRFTYDSSEFYITFTHDDIFEYDTRIYKKDYDAMFDENRMRIEE